MPKQIRMVWLDALRLIAGVSMVGLHSTADPSGAPWIDYEPAARILPLTLRAVIYVARTELFIIISLFLLLMSLESRERSYAETIKEQARRLLIPFLFWCVFFAFYSLIKAHAFGYETKLYSELADWRIWLSYLLLGSSKYHMHFLPTLFGVVLLYPLFRVAIRYPAIGFGVIFCLIAKREMDSFLFAELWAESALPYAVRAVKIVTYVGYGLVAASCLGIWSRSRSDQLEQFLPLMVLGGFLLFSFKIIGTWYTVKSGAWQPNYLPGYWADFLMPTLLFVGVMATSNKRWPPVLSRLAPYSFGIYLCHPIFLDIAEIGLRTTSIAPIAQVGLKLSFALMATSALVALLKRSSLLAWTIGLGPLPFSSLQPRQRHTSE